MKLQLVVAIAVLSFTVAGCGGPEPTPPPAEFTVVNDMGDTVMDFIIAARKQPAEAGAKLEILMESLDANANEFGGDLAVMRDAAKELQSTIANSGGDPEAINAGLDALQAKIEALAPESALRESERAEEP